MAVTDEQPISVGNMAELIDAIAEKAANKVNELKEYYAYFTYYYRKVDNYDYRPVVSVQSSNHIVVSDGGGGYGSSCTATLPKGTYEVTELSNVTRVTAPNDGYVLSFTTRYTSAQSVSIVRIA